MGETFAVKWKAISIPTIPKYVLLIKAKHIIYACVFVQLMPFSIFWYQYIYISFY